MSQSGASIGLRFYAVFLLLFLAGFGLFEHQIRQLIDDSINTSGELIARQLANQVRDDVLNREHLLLHAHASALEQNPMVQAVTIYDEENHILARSPAELEQAGDTSSVYAFPAPITLNDTLIGNVNVRLNAHYLQNRHNQIYNILLACLLPGLLACLLLGNACVRQFRALLTDIQHRINTINGVEASQQETSANIARHMATITEGLEQLSRQTEKLKQNSPLYRKQGKSAQSPSGGYALLLIECLNINQIQRQISPRQARQILQSFQSVVDRSAGLYQGINIETQGRYLLLRFQNDENRDAALRLVYCSWLIFSRLIQLQEQASPGTHIKCRMSGLWAENSQPQTALASNLHFQHELELLQQLCQQGTENDLILAKNFRQFPAILENCKVSLIANHELDEDFYLMEGLEDEVQATLNRQLDELLSSAD